MEKIKMDWNDLVAGGTGSFGKKSIQLQLNGFLPARSIKTLCERGRQD
jgi:hypothetical protein